MIGTLIGIGLGCYTLAKVAEENTVMMNNKQEARAKGIPYYKDSRGKYWATYTGEQCSLSICDVRHNGHDIIYGIHSKNVYFDFTKDKIDKKNKEFEQQGKPFRLREYTEIKDKSNKHVNWKSTFWLFDLAKRKPYRIELTREYPRKLERMYTKVYLKPGIFDMCQDSSIPVEYMSAEEARKWRL